ncbi:hypothetical protein [Parasphingorhabdus sp.]|uniref:hypothetical protein n=1 Tax=Parasphingorhabdus sp. TaxID=2709688 RepID=UPI003A8E2D21
MITVKTAALFLAVIAGCQSASLSAQSRGEKMNKPFFFVNEEFGALALIDGAKTVKQGNVFRDYTFFEDKHECYIIPKQDKYRFVLNHRLPEEAGTEWFSFVSIIYDSNRETDFLSLMRNSKWLDDEGRSLKYYYKNSYDIGISPSEFINLHLRHKSIEEHVNAREEFNRIAGKFHGKLRRSGMNSWSFAPRMVGRIHNSNPHPKLMSVRLYRYLITDKYASRNPVDFAVFRNGTRRFKIIAETARENGPPETVERTFAISKQDCKSVDDED